MTSASDCAARCGSRTSASPVEGPEQADTEEGARDRKASAPGPFGSLYENGSH